MFLISYLFIHKGGKSDNSICTIVMETKLVEAYQVFSRMPKKSVNTGCGGWVVLFSVGTFCPGLTDSLLPYCVFSHIRFAFRLSHIALPFSV